MYYSTFFLSSFFGDGAVGAIGSVAGQIALYASVHSSSVWPFAAPHFLKSDTFLNDFTCSGVNDVFIFICIK